MLCLKSKTNPEWIEFVNTAVHELLIDHAHCEKKAASTAISLINRYPAKSSLVSAMLSIAEEEIQHFSLVIHILLDRSIPLTRDRGDNYARKLQTHARKTEPDKLLDSLLIAALIEARSCERFTILAEHCADTALRTMYKNLLASEASHYAAFTDLSREYFPGLKVKERLEELSEIESGIVQSLGNTAAMHG